VRPVWEHPFERESVRMLTIGKLAALADVNREIVHGLQSSFFAGGLFGVECFGIAREAVADPFIAC